MAHSQAYDDRRVSKLSSPDYEADDVLVVGDRAASTTELAAKVGLPISEDGRTTFVVVEGREYGLAASLYGRAVDA